MATGSRLSAPGCSAGDVAQCDLWFLAKDEIFRSVMGRPTRPNAAAGADDSIRVFKDDSRRFCCRRRELQDLLAGWWQLINTLGAVPRTLVWDSRWGDGAVAGRAHRT